MVPRVKPEDDGWGGWRMMGGGVAEDDGWGGWRMMGGGVAEDDGGVVVREVGKETYV